MLRIQENAKRLTDRFWNYFVQARWVRTEINIVYLDEHLRTLQAGQFVIKLSTTREPRSR
jgi:hypothetical protein